PVALRPSLCKAAPHGRSRNRPSAGHLARHQGARPIPTVKSDAPSRRLNWSCIYCDSNFHTRTRKGLKVTCPKCHRVQPGPAGVRAHLEELEELHSKRRRNGKATTVRVTSEPEPERPIVKPAIPPSTARPPVANPAGPASRPAHGPSLLDPVRFGQRLSRPPPP